MTLQEEIQNGESRTLEYKSELPHDSQKWIKTIVAFANGAGGKFVLGVNNQRKFVGLPKSVDLFELKDNIADTIGQMCEPQIMFDITAEMVGDAQLLIVNVFPGNATPYYIKALGKENGTFIRLGATTRNADWTALEELSNRGRHVYYDEFACPSVKVEDEDIKYLCKDFSERAERKITRKDLENLNLIIGNDKDTATNAYAILLGKHDYTSRIQCARFRGVERVDFLDKKEYELPHKAIRELIINAVIHRNYQISSSVQVAVYDDRVEISSPGTIYGSLTLEEAMEGRSSIRNKTLARTLEKIDMIEGWGSGLKRIFSQCEEYGVPYPVFVEIGDMLRVNFYRPSYKNIGDKTRYWR